MHFTYPTTPIVASLEPTPAPGRSGRSPIPQRVPVLNGVTATIEPGQLVALVGPSGAGKTTLVAARAPPLRRDERRGARSTASTCATSPRTRLRAAIGVVSQDSHLFHDTVGDNLRYARPRATLAEVHGGVRAAQIDDLIASLPDGLDTLVGERGYRLSGGEKQRLAIARMLLKDPAVVILDEATSHLDSENEPLVQHALGRRSPGAPAS